MLNNGFSREHWEEASQY